MIDVANLVYTPNPDFFGADSFTVTAFDGTDTSQPATVSLFVNSPDGISLYLDNVIPFNSGDGVEFNPVTRTVFGIESRRLDSTDPNSTIWVAREIDPETGAELSSFTDDEILGVLGAAVLPNGNLLLLSARSKRVAEYTPDGQLVPGGIDFTSDNLFLDDEDAAVLGVPPRGVAGLTYDAESNTIFAVDFFQQKIVQLDTQGNLISEIDLSQIIPGVSPGGIVIDSATGNFIITDDLDGNTSLHEVTRDGQLVSSINLPEFTGSEKFSDAEGLGFDPATRTLYVSFDDDQLGALNQDQLGDQIAAFNLSPITPVVDQQGNPTGVYTVTSDDPSLAFTPDDNNTDQVQEFGVYVVDDEAGTINGIAPGQPGYEEAALQRAQVLFSQISNLPNGYNPQDLERVLNLPPGTNFGFLQISNGTINTAIQQIAATGTTSLDVELSTEADLENTFLPQGVSFNWNDQIGFTGEGSSTDAPIGTNLQNTQQLEAIDLTGAGASSFQLDVTLYREAAFDNFVGFYEIENASGAVLDPVTGGLINPGEAGYIQAALANQINGLTLTTADQTASTGSATVAEPILIAPFIVVDGTVEQVQNTADNINPQVYFAFIGANSDGVDHIRMLGDNTFGFEDLPSGGDIDYNDMIAQVQITPVA